MSEAKLQTRIDVLRKDALKARYYAAAIGGVVTGAVVSISTGFYGHTADRLTIAEAGLTGGIGLFQVLKSISLSSQANILEGVLEQASLTEDSSLLLSPDELQPSQE